MTKMNITKTGTFGKKDSVTLKKHNLTVEKKMFLFETGSLYIALAVGIKDVCHGVEDLAQW